MSTTEKTNKDYVWSLIDGCTGEILFQSTDWSELTKTGCIIRKLCLEQFDKVPNLWVI